MAANDMLSRESIPEIVEQHAEEAAFLWHLRGIAARAPHYSLQNMADLDLRVEAHLDGLRAAGDSGWELCLANAASGGAPEVFVASILAFQSADDHRIGKMLDLARKSPLLASGIGLALGWLAPEEARPHIERLLTITDPTEQMVGLTAAARHKVDPGSAAEAAAWSVDKLLRRSAYHAAAFLGRVFGDPRRDLASEDLELRFAAARLGTLMRDPASLQALQTGLWKDAQNSREAAELSSRASDLGAIRMKWQEFLKADDSRAAIRVAGSSGDIYYMDWLSETLDDLKLCRLSGEAITIIAGVDLDTSAFRARRPKDYESKPSDDPKDQDVSMDEDDGLPWPNSSAVREWWTKNRSRYTIGIRYLLGNPMTQEWLQQVLRQGKQRQRAASATELALRNPGAGLFNFDAPGWRQKEDLGS
jgi:uncharacterized protein (TIGR02270 family)